MIHEYAVEPELVATWGNRHDFRYFIEKFGLGQPQIVSRYPKRWTKLVWQSFQSDNEVERTRMTELLARLSECMVHRHNYLWQPDRTWLENAHREHERFPFHVILATVNSTDHPRTLIAEGLDDKTPLWAAPRAVPVARSANEMAATVAAMLRIAQVVILVDPYFRPGRIENRRPLEAFLRAIMTGRPLDRPTRVEVHTSLKYENAATPGFFISECEKRLSRCIPEGLQMAVLILSEKGGGELLHNRYILTDVGGLTFGVGLDDGADGETDDVTLMDRAQYQLRWSQHATDAIAFDIAEVPVNIQSGS